jgi:hypothetical protein
MFGAECAIFLRQHQLHYCECNSSCPASTAEHRTINENTPAVRSTCDASATYAFTVGQAQAFLSIRDLLDTGPQRVGTGPDGNDTPAYLQAHRLLYDTMGSRVPVRRTDVVLIIPTVIASNNHHGDQRD